MFVRYHFASHYATISQVTTLLFRKPLRYHFAISKLVFSQIPQLQAERILTKFL